ncbi:GGDEF domain-containing protein [Halomonas daqiaonensis]|nr:GGDEF domain-containing protein [Halomonas daqiaonensis]
MNMIAGAGCVAFLLFLVLDLSGLVGWSAFRITVNLLGIAVTLVVLIALRAGAPIGVMAKLAHLAMFALLLLLALARGESVIAITIPLIYPAPAYLLLDSVARASIGTALMLLCLYAIILTSSGGFFENTGAVLDGAMSITLAMAFQAAVMALYLRSRQSSMARLKSLRDILAFQSTHDQLTGLLNRYIFDDVIGREMRRRSDDRLFAFLMFDIDHFKGYNDTLGHPEGDELLKRISKTVQGLFNRAEDHIFRLGGEEFGIVFRPRDRAEAALMADRLLEAIESMEVPAQCGPHRYITASGGLLCRTPGPGPEPETIYRLADQAMYRAKQAGRARWMEAEDENGKIGGTV